MEVSEVVEPTVVENPVVLEARVRAPVRAFASLDAVNLVDLFDHRAMVMRSSPHVLKGAFRMALRVAFQEIFDGMEANNEVRVVRGWKILLLLPRMLLFRPPRGGVVPRKKLESRIRLFQEGEWLSLLRDSAACSEMAHTSAVRRRRRGQAEDAVRASRALSLVQMGELSSARQALEGAPLAPGNLATLGILTDPSSRPPIPRKALSEEVRVAEPASLLCWIQLCSSTPSRQRRDASVLLTSCNLTDLSPEVTVTSIDGVGAYDLISRNAMLEGLLRMEGLRANVPLWPLDVLVGR